MATVRDAFFNTIYRLAMEQDELIVVTPDLGAPSLDDYRKDFPDRFISVGIAEQSMVSVAAGLALNGHRVVAYGLNPFPITRAYDQVRILLGEYNLPITLCGLNAGLCSAECGYTHMPIEDMGMMRMLPNIKIFNPSDETISEVLAEQSLTTRNPQYIRFDKSISGKIYKKDEVDISMGFTVFGEFGGVVIISYGCFIKSLREYVEMYVNQGEKVLLIDLFSLSFNHSSLEEVLSKAKAVLTIEEHTRAAGLGGCILEFVNDYKLTNLIVERLGLDFSNGYYEEFADRNIIRSKQGLSEENIRFSIEKLLGFMRGDYGEE